MEQIYSFSFSKPGNQNNPGQTSAFLKLPSKSEISKKPKLYHLLALQLKQAVKRLKENMAILQV